MLPFINKCSQPLAHCSTNTNPKKNPKKYIYMTALKCLQLLPICPFDFHALTILCFYKFEYFINLDHDINRGTFRQGDLSILKITYDFWHVHRVEIQKLKSLSNRLSIRRAIFMKCGVHQNISSFRSIKVESSYADQTIIITIIISLNNNEWDVLQIECALKNTLLASFYVTKDKLEWR